MQRNLFLPTNPPYLILYLSTVLLIVPSSLYQPYRFFVRPSSFRRLFPLFSTLLPTLCSTLKDAIVEAITSKRRKLPGTCDYLPRFRICLALHYFLWIPVWIFSKKKEFTSKERGNVIWIRTIGSTLRCFERILNFNFGMIIRCTPPFLNTFLSYCYYYYSFFLFISFGIYRCIY